MNLLLLEGSPIFQDRRQGRFITRRSLGIGVRMARLLLKCELSVLLLAVYAQERV